MLFHVTFTKEINVTVEADTREECEKAAEREASDHRLQDYGDYGGSWDYSVFEIKTERIKGDPPKPDNGVGPDGLMAHISDARREKRTAKLKAAGDVECPECGHVADAEEYIVAEGFHPAIAFCPECRVSVDTDDILDGSIVISPPDDDANTIDLFEQ